MREMVLAQPVFPLMLVPPIPMMNIGMTYRRIRFDPYEHYVPQTIRNRYHILGPNGVITLTIPVKSTGGAKVPTGSVLIDMRKPWVRQHLRSLEAAYRSAPFYDHYMPGIGQLLTGIEEGETFLAVFERFWQHWREMLYRGVGWTISKKYIEGVGQSTDFRLRIKCPEYFVGKIRPASYTQVFGYKTEFVPHLSLIDILMNEGPITPYILTA